MSTDITLVGGRFDGRVAIVADDTDVLSLPCAPVQWTEGLKTVFVNYRRDMECRERFNFVGESAVAAKETK